MKGHHLDRGTWNWRIGLAFVRFSCEDPVWNLPHANTGIRWREDEHSLYLYVWCLLKNTSTKHNKYAVNQNVSMLMISVSQNVLVESEYLFFLENKICPILSQGLPFFCSWNTVGPTALTCLAVGNSCIEGTVVKCCNGIAGESHILYLL